MTGSDFNFISHFLSCLPWTARLVLALGAEAKLDVVPGAAEFAMPFSTLEDARVSIYWNINLCIFLWYTSFGF